MPLDFVTNQEVIVAARKNIGQGEWDYLVGGSESETSLRRNRQALDSIAFRPRILRDVSKIDTSTTLLGHNLKIPVLLAPIGSLQAFTPTGGVAAAQAAAEAGVIEVVSTATQPTLEEIAQAADAPKIFQLYVRGDDPWVKDIVTRAKEAGYVGLAVTVDTAADSWRERPMLTRWTRPSRRGAGFERYFQARMTWKELDWVRSLTDMPLLLKGVQTPEDAKIAIDHGVDVIWVSNHGGRQLDHGQGSAEVLPEIVEAVQGRAEIVLDGAIQRGSDIVKAIALGAQAVAIGRLEAWGLAAGGKDGLVRVLEILESELISALGLLGVTSIKELGSAYVTKAAPVSFSHEMTSWPNLPGGRVF